MASKSSTAWVGADTNLIDKDSSYMVQGEQSKEHLLLGFMV